MSVWDRENVEIKRFERERKNYGVHGGHVQGTREV